jgi:hypothetical protein
MHVYVMEFKVDKSAETALRQIKEKRYADKFRLEKGKTIHLLGIAFSSTGHTVQDWKEEVLASGKRIGLHPTMSNRPVFRVPGKYGYLWYRNFGCCVSEPLPLQSSSSRLWLRTNAAGRSWQSDTVAHRGCCFLA